MRGLTLFIAATAAVCAGQILVYQTARDTTDRVALVANLSWGAPGGQQAQSGDITLTVSTAIKRQQVMGFGGAFTEAAAYNYALMSAENKAQLRELYWGTTGLGYAMGRIPIGSCDFGLSTYSLNDVENDFDMKQFDSSLARDSKFIIPLVKDALAMRPLQLYGSPWSPPAWMKVPHPGQSGQGMNGSAYPLGLSDDPRVHMAWALYISKWVAAYAAQGIPMWGITAQNEAQALQPFESCLYTKEAQRDWLRLYLGPQLRRDWPGLKIMAWDHNKHKVNTNQGNYGPTDHIMLEWVQTMYADPDSRNFLDGFAFHWYQILDEGTFNFDVLEASHAIMPADHFLLNTEACTCGIPQLNNWYGAELYGIDIAGDLASWSAGWVDWNLVLDQNGGPTHILGEACEAPLIYNTKTGVLSILPKYYYLAHFTRFIKPGHTIVGLANSDVGDPTIEVTAVASSGDGKVSVVVVNPNAIARSYVLTDQASQRSVRFSIPPHAIQTLTY
jgi:glucosylceramidase